jgi:hypothetical protein
MPEICIKGAALTTTLNEIAEAYAHICPEEYEAFLGFVGENNKNLIKPSGMSSGGNMMDLCKLPSGVYSFVKHQMRKRHGIDDFFADPKNYYLLCKVWSNCCTKHRKTPTLIVPHLS